MVSFPKSVGQSTCSKSKQREKPAVTPWGLLCNTVLMKLGLDTKLSYRQAPGRTNTLVLCLLHVQVLWAQLHGESLPQACLIG